MTFSSRMGLVYIPAMSSHGSFAQPDSFTYQPGAWNTGEARAPAGPSAQKPAPRTGPAPLGELVAWDPVAGRARWRVRLPQTWTGGVLATDGGLVFHPAGHFLTAYDADDGRVLWTYDIGASAIAAASSYRVGGVQYLALMVGNGGAGGKLEPRRKGRLLVFRLDGAMRPPPPATPPLDLAAAESAKGDADRGGKLFGQFCGVCHGTGPFFPILPRSPAILDAATFQAIVLDGAKKDQGMAPFRRLLDDHDAEDLRAYLLWSAKTAVAARPNEPIHAQ